MTTLSMAELQLRAVVVLPVGLDVVYVEAIKLRDYAWIKDARTLG